MPPLTNPSRTASRAPSSSGTAATSSRAPTPEDRSIVARWPSSPKPVTSVAASAPAASAAREAAALSATIDATASREHLAGGLVPRVEHPDAERLGEGQRQTGARGILAQQPVRVADAGHRHAVERLRASRWCARRPPGSRPRAPPRRRRGAPRRAGRGRAPRAASPTRLIASTHSPPIAHTSDIALAATMRPQSNGSSTTGVKKSAVLITARPASSRTTAASSPSAPTSRSGPPGRSTPASSRLELADRHLAGAPAARRVLRHPHRHAHHPRSTSDSLTSGGVQAPGGPPGLQHR